MLATAAFSSMLVMLAWGAPPADFARDGTVAPGVTPPETSPVTSPTQRALLASPPPASPTPEASPPPASPTPEASPPPASPTPEAAAPARSAASGLVEDPFAARTPTQTTTPSARAAPSPPGPSSAPEPSSSDPASDALPPAAGAPERAMSEPQTDPLDRRSAPRHLRRRGIGLFVGAGAAAFVGSVMTASRIGVLRTGDCRSLDANETFSEATRDCVREPLVYIGASWIQIFANGVAFGLTAGGGAVAGRHDAYWDHRRGRERRSPVGLIAGGASLMSLSIIAGAVVQFRMWGTQYGFTECGGRISTNPEDVALIPLEGCWENRWTGYVIGTEITQLGGVAGVGMLAYGASHRKNTRMMRALGRRDGRLQLRWSPVTTPRLTGVVVSGRF